MTDLTDAEVYYTVEAYSAALEQWFPAARFGERQHVGAGEYLHFKRGTDPQHEWGVFRHTVTVEREKMEA